MKNSLWMKFIAILLCAACLAAAVGSGAALAVLAGENLLEKDAYETYFSANDFSESTKMQLLAALCRHTGLFEVALLAGLLLFAALAVFLCSVAGCRDGSAQIRAGGLNALPLDLYGACMAGGETILLWSCLKLCEKLVPQSIPLAIAAAGFFGYAGCALFVCFCFAFAAQIKMGQGHWFWNSITGWCLRGVGFLFPKLFHFAVQAAKEIFKITRAVVSLLSEYAKKVIRFFLRLLGKGLRQCERTLSLLPVTWQWIITGGALAAWLLLLAVTGGSRKQIAVWCFAALIAVLYGSNCFGTLLEGARRMRAGDLESKVDGKYLVGCFRDFSEELNGLADVAMAAAQSKLKSERMKTELITNVSHDIKTPLTSIINYVDLLEKPHTPEDEAEYLNVLSRQSQRLKKLIEDLIEMSKASTGNIRAEIAEIDAKEAVTQALGEFSDKLTAAGLTPIYHESEKEIRLLADGRLLWRAMSNVLSNAVKYALPGTRLYVDVSAAEDTAIISFKNISGTQLNISAEELMERFVRGDSSRNTEGSGLGLNIAKSLMEIQGGQLQLLVDGDLFKVTLFFRRATG